MRVVPPAVLTAALMKDPALAQLEIRSVIAKEESILEGMTANFIRPPAERIVICAKALCRAENVSPSSGWHRLPLTISAERIGEIVNLNRVSVARQLSFWMKADLVRRDGRKLLFPTSSLPPLTTGLRIPCRNARCRPKRQTAPR